MARPIVEHTRGNITLFSDGLIQKKRDEVLYVKNGECAIRWIGYPTKYRRPPVEDERQRRVVVRAAYDRDESKRLAARKRERKEKIASMQRECEIIKDYLLSHPRASRPQVARALKMSYYVVYTRLLDHPDLWPKPEIKPIYIQPAPAPDEYVSRYNQNLDYWIQYRKYTNLTTKDIEAMHDDFIGLDESDWAFANEIVGLRGQARHDHIEEHLKQWDQLLSKVKPILKEKMREAQW